jgi:phosphatidylserine decarboxylase
MINNIFNHIEFYILILVFIISLFRNTLLASLCLVIIIFLLYFHRNPSPNLINIRGNILYTPTEGKIIDIAIGKELVTVTIFLSIFDNHTQYIPINCRKVSEVFNYGDFRFANMKSSVYNQRLTHNFISDFGSIIITQYTGFFTRRIYSYSTTIKNYKVGDRLGYIRFGSRVDISFSKNSKILKKIGEKVDFIEPLAILF